MSLLETIKGVLDGASLPTGTRNYCGRAEQSAQAPYTVLSRVADVPENTLSSGVIKRQVRIQVDIYGDGEVLLVDIESKIRTAMAASALSNVEVMVQDGLFDPDRKLDHAIMDYSVTV